MELPLFIPERLEVPRSQPHVTSSFGPQGGSRRMLRDTEGNRESKNGGKIGGLKQRRKTKVFRDTYIPAALPIDWMGRLVYSNTEECNDQNKRFF